MKNEDVNKSRVKHIRLPVVEYAGEKDYVFPKKEEKEVSKRDYKEGVKEILQSSFFANGRKMNIFRIKLTGKPTSSDLDEIFEFFKQNLFYIFLFKISSSNHRQKILVKQHVSL